MKPEKVRKISWDLLTARPAGMEFDEYRAKRKAEEEMIRDRTREGFMAWSSVQAGKLVGRVPDLIFVD